MVRRSQTADSVGNSTKNDLHVDRLDRVARTAVPQRALGCLLKSTRPYNINSTV